ncbi:hypothetical protein F2Q69_00038547 [Brassica cretica]|uniref:Uncharacterized protein n=1 Tax=Brassica cretica TaxID=69181 RepID=A0A8S9SI36_BRACR|nr:hypothetical protein F2Q69_00038547 [Brassica cretica]
MTRPLPLASVKSISSDVSLPLCATSPPLICASKPSLLHNKPKDGSSSGTTLHLILAGDSFASRRKCHSGSLENNQISRSLKNITIGFTGDLSEWVSSEISSTS